MSLLDLLFPKRCVNCKKYGSYICPTCFSFISFLETGVCTVCQKAAIDGFTHPGCKTASGLDGVFSSIIYAGITKKLVYSFKYKPYLSTLQYMLSDLFYEGLIQKEIFMQLLSTPSLLVPVPLHTKRFKMRGYNQSTLLAKGLARRLHLDQKELLERVKETVPQFGLTQIQRADNIKGAFALSKSAPEILKGYTQVFLIDDVATSGATLKEAAKVLKKAGIKKVYGLTLAHGE